MGNAVPGMPDMRLGEIKELVETMFTTFTPLYALGYGEALIAEEKAMRSGGGRVIPYRLLTMPLPSEPLASGFVMKLVSLVAPPGGRLLASRAAPRACDLVELSPLFRVGRRAALAAAPSCGLRRPRMPGPQSALRFGVVAA